MSVLKSKRHLSNAEFVNNADSIFVETLDFVAKLSNRYQRFLAEGVMQNAHDLLSNCEYAQNTRVYDEQTFLMRRGYLIEARNRLMALDVDMTHVYCTLMLNPEGAFTDTKGRMKTASQAIEKLDKMAESLGEKIDHEKNMIESLMVSDAKRYKEKVK